MSLEHPLIQAAFDQAAKQYEQHAVLQKEALLRLIERLTDDLKTPPEQILDLGCGTGWAVPELLKLYPEAEIIAADFAESMVAQVPKHPQVESRVTDAHAIDVHAQSCDLLFSNLMIQWCDENTVLQENTKKDKTETWRMSFLFNGLQTKNVLQKYNVSKKSTCENDNLLRM